MDEPICDDELGGLFDGSLGRFRVLVLAVSGGADSTALLHLVARWLARSANRRPVVLAATFDHGLRTESGAEAAWVADQARALGLTHRTLVWSGLKPKSGVQAAARKARYDALGVLANDIMGETVPAAVVTAHHLEDQAETVLMRMARGSGLDGLSGMAAVRWLEAGRVAIVRPLLGVGKDRLRATLEAGGLAWREDPSNQDPAFERIQVRRAMTTLAELGVTPQALGLVARRIARGRDAVDDMVVVAEKRVLTLNGGAFARLSRGGFKRLPEEVRVRILARVLFAFGGQDSPPQLSQVEALAGVLDSIGNGLRTTLGGCLVTATRHSLVVHREPGRGMPVIVVGPGERAWWDRRFEVLVAARARRPVRIGGLSEKAAAAAADLVPGLSRVAATTLPSGWINHLRERSGPAPRSEALVHLSFTYPRVLWT